MTSTIAPETREKQSLSDWLNKHIESIASIGGLAFCLIFFTIMTQLKGESIWSPAKLSTLMSDVIVTALMSVGAVFIYSLGNMDVSIGKQVGLYSTLIVMLGNAWGNLWAPILLCLGIAIVIALINGAAGELLHMYSVISSVVFMMILSGVLTFVYSTLGTRNISLTLEGLTSGIPLLRNPVFMIAVLAVETLIISYFFYFTKFGKYARAIGANQTAAAQSGVNIVLYRVIPYVFMAFCLVTAAVFQMGYTGAASESTGTGFEMNVMVSLILGGMPLKGGMKSRVSCAIIGSFTYSVLAIGLPIIGVPVNATFLVKAIIFVVVVLITCRQKNGVLPR